MSDLTVLVPEFVVTKSLPENSSIIGSKIESNRKRKAGENNRGGEIFGGGKYTLLCGRSRRHESYRQADELSMTTAVFER